MQGGEGGDDARNFADELAAALLKFSVSQGAEPELLATDHGYASFIVKGAGVRRMLNEVGLHCIQRVPDTERGGRRHTSFARVTATPVSASARLLDPRDVEMTMQRGHGKGGQHQNKVSSAVRAKHLPTGISVFINGRSQGYNRDRALQVLAGRVQSLREAELSSHASFTKAQQWNQPSKIRTYNFIDNRATDHRTGAKVRDAAGVLRGNFHLLD